MRMSSTALRGAVLLMAMAMMAGCATDKAYQAPVPDGWQEYQSSHVSLWLPAAFEGGDPVALTQILEDKVKDGDERYKTFLNLVKEKGKLLEFMAIVMKPGRGVLAGTNAMVMRVDMPISYKTQFMLNQMAKTLPKQLHVVSKKVIQLHNHEAGFLLLRQTAGKIKILQEMYLIQYNKSMWILSYTTVEDQYSRVKSMFHTSAGTLDVGN